MKTFAELAEYMDGDWGGNAWYAFGVDEARRAVDALDEVEWQHLREGWARRSVDWQTYLAEVLRGAMHPGAVDLLVEMLYSPETAVALSAAQNLEALGFRLDATDHELLRELLPQADDYSRDAVEALLARDPRGA